MFVDFNTLPQTSRIWIYQADKPFTARDKDFISGFLPRYCEGWVAHGQPLKASFEIKFDQFIILAVDEEFNATSGCSVDDSVRAIKQIEEATGLDFFNRQRIAFFKDDVMTFELSGLKQKLATGMWNEATLTFNNLVTAKYQLEKEWLVPAGSTWLKRYIPHETLKS
jgi:hypothetical protein